MCVCKYENLISSSFANCIMKYTLYKHNRSEETDVVASRWLEVTNLS